MLADLARSERGDGARASPPARRPRADSPRGARMLVLHARRSRARQADAMSCRSSKARRSSAGGDGQDVEGVHTSRLPGAGRSATAARAPHYSPVVRLLFVCMGNICRSPTAEGVMRGLLREQGLEERVEVDSAGTGDWHVGDPPDARATAAARGARDRARRRGAPGHARRLRRLRPRSSPPTGATCATCGRSRRADAHRGGAAAARVRSRVATGAPTSTCPTPTTAATTASSTCSTSSRRPAAGCSTSCAPTAAL